MDDLKPGLFISFILCKEVLFSKDGVPTAYGIINSISVNPVFGPVHGTLRVEGEAEDLDAKITTFQAIRVAAFITIYSDVQQEVEFSIKLRNPVGLFVNANSPDTRKATIEALDKGSVLDFSAEINPSIEGLYWFELYANGELMAKTPLRIIHLPNAQHLISVPGTSSDAGSVHQQ